MGARGGRAYGRAMTTTTDTTAADLAAVRQRFAAFAEGDVATFAAGLHDDVTWNHRNPDRLGGLHRGKDAVLGFLRESVELTAGTLRAEPERLLADGEGHVAAVMRVSGTRPDGRAFDDRQVLLCALEDGRVRTFDQYIGDPPAVTAFWA
jgi:ketosteroid isomerase-like protein